MLTLIVSAAAIVFLNPSVVGVGSFALGKSGEPLLDGFRAIYGGNAAKVLAFVAVIGLIASFHTIIYAKGRQIYSLSRAGYFPTQLSITHGRYKTPHVAMITGALVALLVMFAVWFSVPADESSAIIGGTLLNMAVFGAMFSYILQAISFILLRRNLPNIERPYRSPLGIPGAALTVVIGLVTVYFQLSDPIYRTGVIAVAIWFVIGIIYFATFARHRMVLSPEEEFAMAHRND
jgi:ethanolamine permease